jgi:serine/threonine-protein kinase
VAFVDQRSRRTTHRTPPLGVPATAAMGGTPPAPAAMGGTPAAPAPGGGTIPAPAPSTRAFAQATRPVLSVTFPMVGATLRSTRGSYNVTRVLGSGEFGAVYECVGPFDQVYALKMVRPANRPYEEVQREWAKEVQRLMSLRHPNVVYIHDAFEQEFLFYLALERCDHALSAMLGTPMDEALVLELARQLLAAVQFLHDNDVVHDDLHPGNVLITHGDRPQVKISDFGISNELRGASAVRPSVVHHSIMAPEIIASGYTSKQSDLYQVGLLLFWMLTGAPAVALDTKYEQLLRAVAEGHPRKRAEAIGTPFGMLIAKMLRRREQYRYTSAREVWADLRQLPAWQRRQLFPIK